MPISIAELEAAGLYDPAAPGAAERLPLLQWLADQGATVPQLVRAARTHSFPSLAGDLALGVGQRLTLAEVAARTGVSLERIQAVLFAVGLPVLDADDPILTEEDARAVSGFQVGEEIFGQAAVRRFMQVIGVSLARMAEAAVSVATVNLEGPIWLSGAGELAMAQTRYRTYQSVGPLAGAVAALFKAHIAAAGQRLRRSRLQGSIDIARLTVGFVDLVGFTTLSRRVEPHALATIVEGFEEAAHDVAASHEGRVVKFVGDEVMFVTQSASAACEIALGLIERFVGDATVTPRSGLAAGEILVRGGDYYGPVVNLASRMADAAVPREVLVTEAVTAEAAGGAFRFEPAGRRILKGFEEPVRLFAAERAGKV